MRLFEPNVRKMRAKKNVPGLIKALSNKDWDVYREAVLALGEIGDERAVEPLIAELGSGSGRVRDVAAEALGKIGGVRAVEPLVAALKNSDSAVAAALVNIGPPSVNPLIAALNDKDRDWIVRSRAARALGKIGDERALEPLIAVLNDKDRHSQERSFAAEALGKIGAERAAEPLVTVLKDKERELLERLAAAKALDTLDLPADSTRTTRAWYTVVKSDWSGAVSLGCAAVEPLITALEHFDSNARVAAAKSLGEIGDRMAVEPLISAFKQRFELLDFSVCEAAAEALGKLGWPADSTQATQAQCAVVKKDWSSVVSLGSAAVEPLIVALKHSDSSVRIAAAKALGEIGDTRAVDPLIFALKSGFMSFDVKLGEAASAALSMLGVKLDRQAVEGMIRGVKPNW